MMTDRRHSGRVNIGATCNVHVSHSTLTGVLMNISEDGVAIKFDETIDGSLFGVGRHIQFCCKDSCPLYHGGSMVAIQGDAYIMRHTDDPYVIGCRMNNLSSLLGDYIQSKRLAQML